GCLSQVQADAVKKVYAGPMNSRGERTFVAGAMPGSEMAWESFLLRPAQGSAEGETSPLGSSLLDTLSSSGRRSIMEDWVTEYFRYMVMPPLGPSWKMSDFDFDR